MRVLVASLLAAFGTAAAQDDRCVSIPETIDAALAVQPALSRAEADREIARAQVLAARSERLPQFALFGQAGIGDRQPLDQSRDDQIGISANLEIFTFGVRSAAITAARETLRAAQAGEIQAQIDIAEQAILLYFELLRAERLVMLTSAQTDGYAQEAATVNVRLDRGLVTRSDARQIEARYAAALARREEAEILRDEIAIQLSVFVGGEVSCAREASAARLASALLAHLGDLKPAEALLLAEQSALNLRQAEAQVRSAEAEVRRANRAGRPTLNLNAFVLGNYDDSELPVEDRWDQEERVGFSIRQELFSGGRLRADRAESRGRLRGAMANMESVEQQLEVDVRRAVLGVQRQGAIQSRREAAAFAARDRLDATTLELERGTKTITDFVLANEDYYAAAIEEATAAYIRDQELVRLAAVTGLLLDIDLADVPEAERDPLP